MSIRTDRLRGQIRKEIAAMLVMGEVHDPRLAAMVTITDVKLSRDLQHATVFFAVMDAGERAETREALKSASGYIRGLLGKRLSVRHTPQLRFEADTSMEQGERIDNLLKSIHIPAPTDPSTPPLPETPPGASGETLNESADRQVNGGTRTT